MQIRITFPDGTSSLLTEDLSAEVMGLVRRAGQRRLRELRRSQAGAVSRIVASMRQKEREERRAGR